VAREICPASTAAGKKLVLLDKISLSALDVQQPANSTAGLVGTNKLPGAEKQLAKLVAMNEDRAGALPQVTPSFAKRLAYCHHNTFGSSNRQRQSTAAMPGAHGSRAASFNGRTDRTHLPQLV
jgi:hypothetical protein